MHLTPEQQAIIGHTQGHAKVTAVAGAGKTTTLAHFIRERLQQGCSPRRMMVIMYNKSAQLDFQKKLQHVVFSPNLPQIRTFHSLGLKIYQRLVEGGHLPPFEGDIISQQEQEFQLWRIMQKCASRDVAQDILNDKKKWLDPMMSFVEKVKAGLDPAAVVFKQTGLPKQCGFFVKAFDTFEQWRLSQRRISYSDMLYDPCQLFSRRPDIAQEFSNHLDWVLVDEYQDINPVQQFLLQVVAGNRASVMVIGDPDQTIYEFRGSSSLYMLKYFDEQFPNATRYTLTTSFRYGHDVALLSNQLIGLNKEREPVLALAGQSNPDTYVGVHYDDDYAQKTIQQIKQALNRYSPESICVLLRLWGMSAPIELALLREGIAYQMHHQQWVLERQELQTFMMLLEMSAGEFYQRNERSQYQGWLQFLTFPALKIKRDELDKLARTFAKHGEKALLEFSRMTFPDLSAWQKAQLESRVTLTKLSKDKRLKANQMFNRYIRETDFYKGVSDSAFSKSQVDDRIATIKGFTRFIASLNLTSGDTYHYLQQLKQTRLSQDNKHGVVISSIHRAKGLEWPVVILPGVHDNFYPYQSESEMQQATSVESERRLFYVAMTRVQNELHFVVPAKEGSQFEVSQFMSDMFVNDLLKIKVAQTKKQNSLALPKATQKNAKDYMLKQGWAIEIKDKGVSKPGFKSNRVNSSNINTQISCRHPAFGEGILDNETDRHWHIRFKDGQIRVLDKAVAEPLIQWFN